MFEQTHNWPVYIILILVIVFKISKIQTQSTTNLDNLTVANIPVEVSLKTKTLPPVVVTTTEIPPFETTSKANTAATTTTSANFDPINNAANTVIEPDDSNNTNNNNADNDNDNDNSPYCAPSLCALYNGTHVLQMPHIACHNNGSFGTACGHKPHLLYMSERRRNLILDMHNLARSHIASGKLEGYRSAAHMPQLKWDNELEYLATLHVKRCEFAHDRCRNTERYQFSGQNIGYFWIGREFKSHSRRMKSFVLNWFREYRDANQTFIDSYRSHPEGKKIGHFTMLVADRAHRVGCAAIRYRDPSQIEDMKFLMTCNYDFTNILDEPIYQSGPAASKCVYKKSEKYPMLCDWKDAIYDYDSEESIERDDFNTLNNNIEI